jgi:arsenate reductase
MARTTLTENSDGVDIILSLSRRQFFIMRPSRCLLPLSLLAFAPIWAQDSTSSKTKPTVVFVCEHGSAKSIIAAAEFNRMAAERGLDLNILARGTNPDTEIPKLVRDGLKADGYDVEALKPTKVSAKDLKGATKIVSFGPDLTPWLTEGTTVADWSATPSVSEDYRRARDYIRKQLELLLKDLKHQ